MDEIKRSWYKTRCENQFLKFKRERFQDWFADIMTKAYPGDFQRIRPSQGDQGCDGYCLSTKTVYAVYAPRQIPKSELERKIKSDFERALNELKEKMKGWFFVHNDPDGLASTTAVGILGQISTDHPEIKIKTMCFEEIWAVVETLDGNQMVELLGLGPAPDLESMQKIQMKEIIGVLNYIEKREVPANVPVDIPNPEKLEYNQLNTEVKELLKSGRRKEKLVQNYVDRVRAPDYGERLAQSFREKYRTLKDSDFTPNEIFDELRKFTGGDYFQKAPKLAAVLAVLSYFFERCDIFENPRE